jgi:nucleoside-diphosphate-sugar epimerase
MHVLVTGAAGFIGRAVVEKARTAGWQVTAVVRRPAADADYIADLRHPIEGWPVPDAVIHLAGGYAGAGWRELEASDIRIAQNLIAWGRRAGVGRWVVASAAEVYGVVRGAAGEDWPCRPVIPYGAAKLQVERMFETADLGELTICRLGEVYGHRGRILREIPERLRRGFCPWPGDGNVKISFLHVEDAAEALVRACGAAVRRGEGGCEVFNVGDAEPRTWRDFLDGVARLLGTRRAAFLPLTAARAYAVLAWSKGRLTGRPSAVTPWVMKLLTVPKVLASTHIRERLGFTPKYPGLESGLPEALGEV